MKHCYVYNSIMTFTEMTFKNSINNLIEELNEPSNVFTTERYL